MASPPAPVRAWHDNVVRILSDLLLADGHSVLADIPGYPHPGAIRGSDGADTRFPDIMAMKDGITMIIEVESEDSYGKDGDQRRVFREYVKRRKNTLFFMVKM